MPITVTTVIAPEPANSTSATGTPPPLWEQLEEAKIEDMDTFTSLFSRQVIERKPTKKKTEKPSKQQVRLCLTSVFVATGTSLRFINLFILLQMTYVFLVFFFQQAVKILDSKRSQNIGILASSLHKDFSEIEHG